MSLCISVSVCLCVCPSVGICPCTRRSTNPAPYYIRKPLTIEIHPLLWKDIHFYRRKSLTTEGHFLLWKEIRHPSEARGDAIAMLRMLQASAPALNPKRSYYC